LKSFTSLILPIFILILCFVLSPQIYAQNDMDLMEILRLLKEYPTVGATTLINLMPPVKEFLIRCMQENSPACIFNMHKDW
jgi:hypothetical protein